MVIGGMVYGLCLKFSWYSQLLPVIQGHSQDFLKGGLHCVKQRVCNSFFHLNIIVCLTHKGEITGIPGPPSYALVILTNHCIGLVRLLTFTKRKWLEGR